VKYKRKRLVVGWTKQSAEAAVKARIKNGAERKQKRIDDYNASPKKCAVCDNHLNYLQNVGKITFCSISCANTVRKRDVESRKKTSDSIKAFAFQKRKERAPVICKYCGVSFTSLLRPSHTYHCGSDDCIFLGASLAAKKARITAKENGTFTGWKVRTVEPSYAEQYFLDLFENEKIDSFECEYNVGRWFIDFAFLENKIAIEVDGKQHLYRKELDEEKDKFLQEQGWKVFRIEWFNPVNDKNKARLYPQIEQMKEILGM
jgi:very-short-patch-repair endonuclease